VRKLLFTTALVLPLAAPGLASAASLCGTDPTCTYNAATDTSYFDPTSFHVTSSIATGSDPVLLNNSTAFSIQDINNQNINQPLTIFIATPIGAPVPVISTATYVIGSTTTPLSVTPVTTVNGITFPSAVDLTKNDLYTAVGCTACGNSLNKSNIDAAYALDGLSATTSSLEIYAFQVNASFVGQDEVNVTGIFADGDIVFPYAANTSDTGHGKSVTEFDTSWTNAGFVDCNEATSKCGTTPPPPPPDPVPEPSSLLVLGVGLLGLGYTATKRRS
jgi:hypothetical protein